MIDNITIITNLIFYLITCVILPISFTPKICLSVLARHFNGGNNNNIGYNGGASRNANNSTGT